MNVLLVTYDLIRETVRPKIVDEVKRDGCWAKLSESSYAIGTSETPDQVYARFAYLLDENDSLYVITLRRPMSGQGPDEVNEWLKNRMPW